MSFWDGPPRMDRDTAAAHESLRRARLNVPREAGPALRLESGHALSWSLHHHLPLSSPAEWVMSTWHPGDPAGTAIRSHLGFSDEDLGERSLAKLRHRDVVREMGEQWKRASAAGDPYGEQNPTAGWVPMGDQPSHVFRHYG
jgi:hypothetical protein